MELSKIGISENLLQIAFWSGTLKNKFRELFGVKIRFEYTIGLL